MPILEFGYEKGEERKRAEAGRSAGGPCQASGTGVDGISRADRTGSAGRVDHNDIGAQTIFDLAGDDADNLIGRTAGCPWNDDLNGTARLPGVTVLFHIASVLGWLTSSESKCENGGEEDAK